jgi:hypothetical protein
VSHVGVRIVANWLADPALGVNALLPTIPRLDGDPMPPTVSIFDETRAGWVARNQVPKPTGPVQFPAVIVFLQNTRWDSSPADSQASGARTIDSDVQLAVQLVMQDSTTEEGVSAGMYIMRAIRNSLLLLDEPAADNARTLAGVRLWPSKSLMQGQLDAPVSDNIVSIGAFVAIYPTIEVTALTLDT